MPGSTEESPSSTPELAVVLNQTLNPSGQGGGAAWQYPADVFDRRTRTDLPAVGHHTPSSGIHELVPLKVVAVTPETGPAAPGVVLISVAGGFMVVRSFTGTSLAAAVVPVGSFSRK